EAVRAARATGGDARALVALPRRPPRRRRAAFVRVPESRRRPLPEHARRGADAALRALALPPRADRAPDPCPGLHAAGDGLHLLGAGRARLIHRPSSFRRRELSPAPCQGLA